MRVCDRCKRELNSYEAAKCEFKANGLIFELCHDCKKYIGAVVSLHVEAGVTKK